MSKETVPSMGTVYRQQVNKWTRGKQCSRNTFTTFQREGCLFLKSEQLCITLKQAVQWCCICPRQLGTCRNHRCCTSRHLRRLMCEGPVNWLFQIHIYHLPEGGLSISQAAEAWGIYSLPRCLLNFSSGEPYNFGRAERRWRRRGHVNCLAQALVESSGATHGVTSFKKTCLHHCQMIQPFNRCNISC